MQEGQSSRRLSRKGILLLIIASLVGGVVIGGFAYVAANMMYLAVVFPLALAYAGTVAMDWAVTRGKTRNQVVAGAFGLLLGLLIFATYQYGQYVSFREEAGTFVAYTLEEQLEGLTFSEHEKAVEDVIDEVLRVQTGSTGFLGYLRITAQEGIRLAWWFGSDADFTVDFGTQWGPVATWIYRVTELAAIAGLIMVGATVAAGRPYCERCDDWWGDTQHICPGSGDLSEFIAHFEPSDHPTYVGFWKRCGATLIDGALLSLAGLLFGPYLWYLSSTLVFFLGVERPTSYAVGSDVSIALVLVLIWLYFSASESSGRQATLGKMAMGLMVTDLDGERVSFVRASKRHWAKLLSAIPLGIGFVLAEVLPNKQTLHDLIAGTVVVRTGG